MNAISGLEPFTLLLVLGPKDQQLIFSFSFCKVLAYSNFRTKAPHDFGSVVELKYKITVLKVLLVLVL